MESSCLTEGDIQNENAINDCLQLHSDDPGTEVTEEQYLFVKAIQDDFHGCEAVERSGRFFLVWNGFSLSEESFKEYVKEKMGELTQLAREYVYPMSIDALLLNSLTHSVGTRMESNV